MREAPWALAGVPSLLGSLMGVEWHPEDRSGDTGGQYARHRYFLNLVQSHFPNARLEEELDERLVWRLNGNKKYILGSKNGLEIYDLTEDPGETRNLAGGESPNKDSGTLPFLKKDALWLAEEIETSKPRMSPGAKQALEQLGYL